MGSFGIFGLEKYFDEVVSGGRLDEGLRAHLNRSIHAQMSTILVGCFCALLSAWTCYIYTRHSALFWFAIALSVAAVIRIAATYVHKRQSGLRDDGWLLHIYPIAAFGFAGCVGLVASTTIAINAPIVIQLLAMTYAIAYASGISMRSAGRPVIALGQVGLTIVPILVMLVMAGSLAHYVLAIIIPGMMVGTTALTITLFRTMTKQANLNEDLRMMADVIERQAHEDPITELLNRAGLDNKLTEACAAIPQDAQLALIWLDLHRFKEVNDSLGHTAGDLLLNEMGRRLTEICPDSSVIARFGSDEFVIGVALADRHKAERLCQKISDALAQPVRVAGQRIESGAAVGAALMPDDAQTLEKLMQSADIALFNAKIGGRHKVSFFDHSMTRALARRKEMEADLRTAIQKDELSVFFQPIVDLETGKVRCFEALLRWFHPEKGELRPDEFIPVAEETGLIITLGNWVTAQAARAAATWPDDVMLAVNLSPVQIKAPGAALGILAAIKDAGLDPRRVELEVTESLFLEDDDSTARFMQDLAQKGVRFALDDFGTGYSALHYINKYPFRKIKVDRSFVSGPDHGPKTDAIIRAVAEMGATLDMEIVAEGLETIGQVQFVKQAGCTLGQGFFFSRAVPDYLAAILLAEEEERLGATRLAG